MSKKILDCQNMPCPEPVLYTKKMLAESHPSQCTIIVDNAAAKENVVRFLQSQGYTVTPIEKDNLWYLDAMDIHTCSLQDAQEHITVPMASPVAESEKILVTITSACLGVGDNVLGQKLMKNYIGTLAEMGESLWRIILLNGGVQLSAPESVACAALQSLEASGVSILVCGTCLEHFGLLERKAVGQTTNMLDVVTSMQHATKVITI